MKKFNYDNLNWIEADRYFEWVRLIAGYFHTFEMNDRMVLFYWFPNSNCHVLCAVYRFPSGYVCSYICHDEVLILNCIEFRWNCCHFSDVPIRHSIHMHDCGRTLSSSTQAAMRIDCCGKERFFKTIFSFAFNSQIDNFLIEKERLIGTKCHLMNVLTRWERNRHLLLVRGFPKYRHLCEWYRQSVHHLSEVHLIFLLRWNTD